MHKILKFLQILKKDKKPKTFQELKEYIIQGIFDCRIIRVYDGDTVWACIKLKDKYWKLQCRLVGIDTPEMPQSHSKAMTEESQRAFKARDRVVNLVTNSKFEQRVSKDTSGNTLPSLSDNDLQKVVDQNTLVLKQGLQLLNGTDKYGRYLARLKIPDGRDLGGTLIQEGLAVPFMEPTSSLAAR